MRRSCFLLLALLLACSSASTTSSDAPANDGMSSPGPVTKPEGESKQSEDKTKDPSTSIVVGIDSEPFGNQGYNLSGLSFTVKVDGLVAATAKPLAKDGPLFPREVRVEAPSAKTDAEVEIEVAGIVEEGPLVTRWVRTRFVPGRSKLVHVYLQTRCVTMSFLGGYAEPEPQCTAAQTCVSGACIAPDVAPNDLPDYRADWTTSPPDACGNGGAPTIATTLAEDATVTLEQGGQCGHHFYVDLSMNNLSQWKTVTSITAVMPNAAVTIPETSVPYTWSRASSGACELGRVRFQVDTPGHKVEEYLGQALDLTISGKDDKGHTATATRHLKVADRFLNPTGRPCN